MLATSDRLVIADVSESGSPNSYITATNARSYFDFDIKDDVTSSANIANTDRLVFSDESASGDPNRYTTFQNFRTELNIPGEFDLHDDATTNLSTISTADRMLISDEGTTGDPQRYVSVSQLDTRFGGNLGSDITAIVTLSQDCLRCAYP